MNRREFLWRTGLTAGALTMGNGLMGNVARAAGEKDHYFVFGYFQGGWDALLSLDPRDPAMFTDDLIPQTQIQPAYNLLPAQFSRQMISAGGIDFGPCIGEMAGLTDHFSVVRGINMATLTHEVGARYFNTGRPPSGITARGSSISTVAAAQMPADRPVPHLAHRVESFNEDLAAYAGAMPVAAVDQVQYILQENLGIPTDVPANVKGALGAYWSKHKDCDQSNGAGGSRLADIYRQNRQRARDVVTSNLHRQFQFNSPETEAVRRHYGFGNGQAETAAGRAALAAQALKTGLSRVVSVVLADNLDTHDGNWANTQSTQQQQGFNALARLITDLRDSEAPGGGSMLDKTTIFVYSEFTRTPRLNARNGRDHHLGNCAIVAGAGVRGGQVIGSSNDQGMGPELINLATGKADENGVSLQPEHVLTTLLTGAGFDASILRSEPIPALIRL